MKNLILKLQEVCKSSLSELSFIISGGGTASISEFLRYGGSSSFLIDAYIPYNQSKTIELLKNNNIIANNDFFFQTSC